MKAVNIFRSATGVFLIVLFAVFCAFPLRIAHAQSVGYLESSKRYGPEELAQMLAPIALYPDALLSQILMAATYPIEVIEADRWVKKNPALKGDALDNALLGFGWDPSVKALCHFPSVLALMSERIGETTEIGNAFLAQEGEVLDTIQNLRSMAYSQGNLATTPQQTVIVERETIIIEPATPRVVYVPYYDPLYIYGPWRYPAYPPYYWGPSARVSVGVGISFWPGFHFGFVSGPWSYFDWHFRYIYIDVHKRPRYVRHDRWVSNSGRWIHAPVHRRGVAYRDIPTARKYGQYPTRPRQFSRDTRGFPDAREPYRSQRPASRTSIDRDMRGAPRSGAEPARQEAPRIDRSPAGERQTFERDRQARPRDGQDPARQSFDRGQQQRSRDNVFNRVEDGRRESQSSQRGQRSRQESSRGDRDRSRR